MVVHGTAIQESPQRRRRDPTIQTLSDKSWDSIEEVLGHCSLGTVVMGQWSRDSGLGTLVLGQWSWDSSLGTVVLGL